MRQDKDRSAKWLLTHHGDAVLKLGGITGFTSWKSLQPETVAPRRLPDGLIEVKFPDQPDPSWVLVEIETYPDSDADRQVFEDLMLIAVDRKMVPEVVSLVLKPKGNLEISGQAEQSSKSGGTWLGGRWNVVKLWEKDSEELFAANDVGLIPWVPLTRSAQPPEETLTRCRDRIARVENTNDRSGLMAVTQILAAFAYSDRRFLNLFGGSNVLIDSPALDEVKKILLNRGRVDEAHDSVIAILEARFGAVPEEIRDQVTNISDLARLRSLVQLSATCPDLATFAAKL